MKKIENEFIKFQYNLNEHKSTNNRYIESTFDSISETLKHINFDNFGIYLILPVIKSHIRCSIDIPGLNRFIDDYIN